MDKKIIKRKDALKRNLNECIIMFFEEREELSINTIASACLQLSYDLLPKGSSLKKFSISNYKHPLIKKNKEARDFISNIYKGTGNKLKHGDKDGEEDIVFFSMLNDIIIYYSCLHLRELDKEGTFETCIFENYYVKKYNDENNESYFRGYWSKADFYKYIKDPFKKAWYYLEKEIYKNSSRHSFKLTIPKIDKKGE